ncbi:HNH endonuclease signature motif containing protein [Mycetocola reblochoni]|uniref:HNH endonuclease n=1 Tax=Mycetocola reblochoni TaxID=331618 RepID=UPI00117D3780
MIAPKAPTLSKAQEKAAYERATYRDKNTCQRCGRWGMTRDHRKERSRGGRTTPANLQGLCGSGTTGCHGWKGENPGIAVLQGYGVPGWADPTQWPARRYAADGRHIWCLYDDEGGWVEISSLEAAARINGTRKEEGPQHGRPVQRASRTRATDRS